MGSHEKERRVLHCRLLSVSLVLLNVLKSTCDLQNCAGVKLCSKVFKMQLDWAFIILGNRP